VLFWVCIGFLQVSLMQLHIISKSHSSYMLDNGKFTVFQMHYLLFCIPHLLQTEIYCYKLITIQISTILTTVSNKNWISWDVCPSFCVTSQIPCQRWSLQLHCDRESDNVCILSGGDYYTPGIGDNEYRPMVEWLVGETSAPLPLCPPRISHDVTLDCQN
jgi:hypothetical protein